MITRSILLLAFLMSFSLNAQVEKEAGVESEEVIVLEYLPPIDTGREVVNIPDCRSSIISCLYDESRFLFRPKMSEVYDEPEYIMVEREPFTIDNSVYPPVHRNRASLNKRVYTHSDIYFSPYRR